MRDQPSDNNALGRREFFTGLLCLGITACTNARNSAEKTLKENAVIQIEHFESDADEMEKIIIDNENVSEGFKAMAELSPGHSFIGKFEGNGGRDSLIYTPKDFDPNLPAEIMYFYHGTGCHIVKPPTNKDFKIGQITRGSKDEPCVGTRAINQVLGAMERAHTIDKNVILVYPLSNGPRNHNKYDMQWMHGEKESFQTLHREVLSHIQKDMKIRSEISTISVKGHSAGGIPLVNIMKSLKSDDTAMPDKIVFLDASYWSLKKAYSRAITANPDINIRFLLHNPKYTGTAVKGIAGLKGVEFFDTNGVNDIGERITHGKLMRNYLLGFEHKNTQFAED